MFVKYIVKKDNEAVVIKYDLRTNNIQIGGYCKFIALIHQLVNVPYFEQLSQCSNSHSQRNKLRYEAKIELGKFLEIINKITQDFSCERALRVNRLI